MPRRAKSGWLNRMKYMRQARAVVRPCAEPCRRAGWWSGGRQSYLCVGVLMGKHRAPNAGARMRAVGRARERSGEIGIMEEGFAPEAG